MAELAFDIALDRPGFRVEMAATIPAQGVTAIMGPSGSGKTTLLSALAGLEPKTMGRASLAGRIWMDGGVGLSPRERRVGYVFQDNRLFPHLSVAENIRYGARRRGVAPAVAAGIGEALGLAPLLERRPATLSGGEARRVALARALASGPDMLFLDEPLSGLDEAAKAQLLPYIAQAVAGSGIPALYVTHAQAEVTALADRVLLVANGRVRGWGVPPASLAVSLRGSARPGAVAVELGGAEFVLPGAGQPGDARRIVLPPAATLLSRQHPGETAGLAVLPARVLAWRRVGAGAEIALTVAGQPLTRHADPGTALAERELRVGEDIWLTILSAVLR
ncbi:MAG: ATP-binding cassette domain-containing protein [Pseudomonadota bacterium]